MVVKWVVMKENDVVVVMDMRKAIEMVG